MGVSFPLVCREAEAPSAPDELVMFSGVDATWHSGVPGGALPQNPARDTVVVGSVIVMVALLLVGLRNYRSFWKYTIHALFDVRERDNAFDEPMPKGTRSSLVLALQLCISLALLFYSWFAIVSSFSPPLGIGVTIGLLLLLTLCYIIFQIITYCIVGWTFCGVMKMGIWLRGLMSSMALSAILLCLPSIAAIFYPQYVIQMIITALICFVFCRILFIFKGFRIFYDNFFSLLYFILYLCALEIIPVIVVYTGASLLCEFY